MLLAWASPFNAVNLYSIGYCWPTHDRPRHARFAVESFFKSLPAMMWWRLLVLVLSFFVIIIILQTSSDGLFWLSSNISLFK